MAKNDEALTKLAGRVEVEVSDADVVSLKLKEAEGDARDHRANCTAQVESMDARIKERDDLKAKILEEGAEAKVLEALASELQANRFIAFMQQETLDLLAVRASEELMRISDGRYSLVSKDGRFSVVDHVNADEQRTVDTLSGGETFMASLSLRSRPLTTCRGSGS